jgi:hypothetical protein
MDTVQSQPQNASFLKSIKNAIPKHCSNCGERYTQKDLSLIQKDDFNAILHLTCSRCKESYLINVVSPQGMLQGSSRIPLKIDIASPKEARKFIGKAAISSDDILEIHKYLQKLKDAKELSLKKSKTA